MWRKKKEVKKIQHYHLEDVGLAGEHKLIPIEKFMGTKGSMSGSFFFGFGGISGQVDSEYRLQFAWEPKPGEMVITSMPYSKFCFTMTDNDKQGPTIKFCFGSYMDSGRKIKNYPTYCNRESCKTWGNLDGTIKSGFEILLGHHGYRNSISNGVFNPNDVIKEDLKIAKIRISRKIFESGKCFLNMPDSDAK